MKIHFNVRLEEHQVWVRDINVHIICVIDVEKLPSIYRRKHVLVADFQLLESGNV